MRKTLFTSAAYANSTLAAAVALVPGAMSEGDVMERYAPDLACMVDYWNKTDAIVAGYDAIRAASEKYLPRFADEDTTDYDRRLQLTKFTNVYSDIVEGLAAKPFEEEVTFANDPDAAVSALAEDIDGNGNNQTVFASQVFFNGINSAIHWIYVDYPVVDRNRIVTQADQKRAGIRPYWTHVLGRNVREVRTAQIGSKREIIYIRIFEPTISDDEKDCVRVFKRDITTGVVSWELWRKTDNVDDKRKTQYVLENMGTLSIGVIPLVPFITGRRDGTGFKIHPMMQDAADLQIQLYQDESGLKYIKTLTAYPMLAANGLVPELEADNKTPKKVKVGPSRVLWGLPDGNGNHGSWGYVEPSAASMKFLAEDIEKTKQDLRELGRQPLTATSGNLTVITTAVAAGKARSAVSAWALLLKDALENAWKITIMYLGVTSEPEINVYNEFDAFADGNSDLDTLDKGRQRGDISRDTYWKELRRRKVLSPEFSAEKEAAALLKEVPGDGVDPENEDDTTTQPPLKVVK